MRQVQADAARNAADLSTRERWRGPYLVVALGLMGLVYDLASPWRWVATGLLVLLFAAVVLVQRSRARLRVHGAVWLRHQDDRSFWRWYLSFGPGLSLTPAGRATFTEHVAALNSIINQAGTSLRGGAA